MGGSGGSPSLSGMSSPYEESSSLAFEQTELEVVTNIVQGHQPMMTVLSSRHRNLQVVYNLWQNKDAKVSSWVAYLRCNPQLIFFSKGCCGNSRDHEWPCCYCGFAERYCLQTVSDLPISELSEYQLNPFFYLWRFLWSLDLCVLLLPAIADLLQSKFEV